MSLYTPYTNKNGKIPIRISNIIPATPKNIVPSIAIIPIASPIPMASNVIIIVNVTKYTTSFLEYSCYLIIGNVFFKK